MSTSAQDRVKERMKQLRERQAELSSTKATSQAGAAPPPPTSYVKCEREALPEGHVMYTDVFGPTSTGRDYYVRKFNDDDWPESLRGYIPQVDSGYIYPQEQTERFVTTAIIRGKRSSLLYGPKGSGKSTLGEQVCAQLRIPFIRVNMSEDAESSRIFGGPDVQDGSMGWVVGPAEMAARAGCFLQVDEVSACPPGINLAMQWMLEKGGNLFIPDRIGAEEDRMIIPATGFHIVCTDNTVLQGDTTGKYAGTNVQNEAFLDRMSTAIHIGYLSERHERSIIEKKYPEVPASWVASMLKVARLIRGSYDESQIGNTISPRGLLEWADDALFWGDLGAGFRDSFFNKLIDEDKRIVGEHYHTATGQHVPQ